MNSRTKRLLWAGSRSHTISSGPRMCRVRALRKSITSSCAQGVLVEPEVEVAKGDAGGRRKLLPVEVELEHRRPAARRPRAAAMRPLAQPAFVDEDDRAALFLGFFLRAGQVLVFPLANRLLVALAGLADRSLRAPVERPQQLPDVALVVGDAKSGRGSTAPPADKLHSGVGETVSLGTFEQHRFELRELAVAQQGLTSGRARALARPACPSSLVALDPAIYTLLRCVDSPRRLGLAQPFLEYQPHGFDASLFQRRKVSLHAFRKTHV